MTISYTQYLLKAKHLMNIIPTNTLMSCCIKIQFIKTRTMSAYVVSTFLMFDVSLYNLCNIFSNVIYMGGKAND